MAHVDAAGKTTTTERILYYTGKIYKTETYEGASQMDWRSKSKNVVSLSHLLRQPLTERHSVLTSSSTPGHGLHDRSTTFIYVLDGAVTVLTHNQVLSLKQKQFGVKRLNTVFLVSYLRTRWIKIARLPLLSKHTS